MITASSPVAAQDVATSKKSSIGGQDLGEVLGKEDFLKLLLTQVQNQDPLNPMEDKEFVSQLAQFSSLEQLQNVNTNLKSSLGTDAVLTRTMNTAAGTALIGKDVVIGTDAIDFDGRGDVNIGYSPSARAVKAVIQILNSENTVLRTMEEAASDQGLGFVTWDGKDDEGATVPAGSYKFKVSALGPSGNDVGAEASLVGRVTGMRYKDGVPVLVIGGVQAPITQLEQVSYE